MKIGVCIKRVPGSDSRIEVSNVASGPDLSGVSWEVNPYDSAMVIDDGSVVRGVSSAAEPPDGRYIMTSVYMITIS